MSTEENRDRPSRKKIPSSRMSVAHTLQALAGALAVPCLVVSFIMAIFLFLLPPVGDFVCGVLAVLGIILGMICITPWALKGFLGVVGLVTIAGGLTMYALGWSYGEPFYQAGVEVLNSYTDPVEREIWPDHERSKAAQDSWATETEAEMGQDILQFFGTIVVLFGLFLLVVNVLVGFVTGGAAGGKPKLATRAGVNIAALGFILLFIGLASEMIIAEIFLLEQESWRVVANALVSGSFSFLFSMPTERFLMAMLAAVGSLGVVVLWLGVTVLALGGSLTRKIVFAAAAVGIALFVFSIVAMVAIVMLAVVAVAFVGGLLLGSPPASSGGEEEEWVQTRFGPQRKRDL